MLKGPGDKRLKVKRVGLLSSFAFNFNLRRYNLWRDELNLIASMLSVATQAGAYTRSGFSST
jgi:hypothetical protein